MDEDVESGNIGKQEASPKNAYKMRFADSGEPISISVNTPSEEVMNQRTSFREERTEASINPKLTEKLPVGSILNLGEGQTFQIVEPSKSAKVSNQNREGIYVRRIPLTNSEDLNGNPIKGYNQLKDELKSEGKTNMIFEIGEGNVPLGDETAKFFPTPIPTPVEIKTPVKV